MQKKRSLKGTIILVVLLFICLPFLLFGTYYNSIYSNTLTEHAEKFLTTSIEIINRDIERNFQFTNDTSMNFLADKVLREKLNEYINTSNPYIKNQLKYEIERQLQFSLNFNSLWREKLLNTIFIFIDKENYFSITRNIPNDELAITHTKIFQNSNSMEGQSVFIPSPNLSNTIYFIRTINDLEQFKPIGKMILGLDSSKFNEVDDTLIQYDNILTFTFSDKGTIFFHSNKAQIGQKINDNLFNQRNQSNIFEYTIDDEIYYMRIIKIDKYNLYSAIGIPKNEVLSDAIDAKHSYYITLFIVLFSSLIMGTVIFSKITKPLVLITNTVQKIKEGDFHNKLPSFKYQELNKLSMVFNQMIEKLDFSINQVYKKQLLLQEAELKMLQSQVNPHFLFNVLDTISWEAVMNGQPHIQELLTSLAELIRHNIAFSNKETITIAEELGYINYYLQLQKARFEDKLSVTINIENQELEKYYIPKLSIHPFIDNAIVHGIEPKDSDGLVQLNIYTRSNDLICEIIDNGIGFDPTHKKTPDNDHEHNKHNHIGIINIEKRIQLLYGQPYGIEINSTLNSGTKIVITLPIIKDGEYKHV